jgi:hypothetical protein
LNLFAQQILFSAAPIHVDHPRTSLPFRAMQKYSFNGSNAIEEENIIILTSAASI